MEQVIVRQNRNFEFEVLAEDEDGNLGRVMHIHELTPYTMMLVSLGLCTTIVLHTYASHHDVDLEFVQLTLTYQREEREEETGYEEKIREALQLQGDLSDKDQRRLRRVAHHCSIHQMLEKGITIESEMLETL